MKFGGIVDHFMLEGQLSSLEISREYICKDATEDKENGSFPETSIQIFSHLSPSES